MTGFALTLLVPTALWALGHILSARSAPLPPFPVYPVAGFFSAPALLRWCGRSFPEQAAAWVLSVVAWAGVFTFHDGQVFVASGLVGAAWGFALGLKTLRIPVPTLAVEPRRQEAAPDSGRRGEPDTVGFTLELRCPTCGAALAVPVYHRMARCEFCGSEHVVVAARETLVAVIPDTLTDEAALKAAVLKHLGHVHYLELYDRRVRPLVEESEISADEHGHGLGMLAPERTPAIVNAVEAEVARAADAYVATIAPRLAVRAWRRFLSPYWHRLGTLYQAAFGRDVDGSKRMEFAVSTLECSLSAAEAELPPMGKLSYLRALRPLLGAPESQLPALPVAFGPEEIDRRVQQFGRRSTELPFRPIAVHATLVPEVVALVYRPWHLATVELDGESFELLLDGGAAAVEGPVPTFVREPSPLGDLHGETPTLTPSRCPECGAELPFAPDAEAHLCRNCYRLVAMSGNRWVSIPYVHEEPEPGRWLVPFWRFPLRLRTATGELVSDLAHLTDGVDGAYDQIGERPQVQQDFFVPAFRARVSKAGVRLYRRLWPLLQAFPRVLGSERFSPAQPPARLVDVTLPASEARAFARVYLALAFTQRDLARAQVKTVRERFLTGRLEGDPELAFLSVPEELIGPAVSLFGRARVTALAGLEGGPAASSG